MKRYLIIYITFIAALFAGCTKDLNDTPEMKDAGVLEVATTIQGEEVRSLGLSSDNHTVVVDITLNNNNIYWQAVSSQEWCKIDKETHRGTVHAHRLD